MRAMITGGQGFVGQHLVQHLREMGDEVTIADREVDVTDRATVRRHQDRNSASVAGDERAGGRDLRVEPNR